MGHSGEIMMVEQEDVMANNEQLLSKTDSYENMIQALCVYLEAFQDKEMELKESNYQLQQAFVTIKRNLTLLEKQNRRTEEANRSKSVFLANMSHELRTPLNGIIGFAELIYDGVAGETSPEQKEYLGDILMSARRLLQLINDVLDLSKVEAGKMIFKPHPIEPMDLILEVKNTLTTLVSKKNITFNVSVSSGLADIIIDPDKFEQVLYNYISNAIKFTPENGTIDVIVMPEDTTHFRLEVRDTGVGILPENFDKLFIEFQQIDTGSRKKNEGSGLGLVITRRIIEAQGGSVGVKSQFGHGSVFYAILPYVTSSGLASS